MLKIIITLILSIGIVQAAKLVGRDYPYYIFQDEGLERWCMQPDNPQDKLTDCFTAGVKTECKVLPINAGYIDCGDDIKPNDEE